MLASGPFLFLLLRFVSGRNKELLKFYDWQVTRIA